MPTAGLHYLPARIVRSQRHGAGATAATGATGAMGAVGLSAVAICEAGAEVDATGAFGALLTTVRVGPAGEFGATLENAGAGIGIVRVGASRNGSTRAGRFGVTPGESRRTMCGVIITTSSVLFFWYAWLRNR